MTAAPPLLSLMEGRRVRPRRAKVSAPRELELHMAAANLLRRHLRAGWIFGHVPSGELRTKQVAAKLQRMGAPRGWPDLILFDPQARLHALELKRVGGTLSDDQAAFQLFCIRAGARYSVAETAGELRTILIDWHCLDDAALAACRADGGGL